jgi:hypothetical protein
VVAEMIEEVGQRLQRLEHSLLMGQLDESA